jgi:hypothetical protein
MIIAVEPGETILPKEATSDPMTVAVAKKYGVPGFATGGIAGLASGITASYNSTQVAMVASMEQALLAAIKSAAAKAVAGAAGGGASPPNASAGSVQALMQQMAAARGWTGAQWTALYNVEMREAGFSLTAQNPHSAAYGLAQFINGPSEYAQYGGNASTAAGQITAMLNYIAQRYGTPEAAWAMEQSAGYYGNGGMITEPVIGFGTQSGRGYVLGERGPEMVTPAGGSSISDVVARLERLIQVTAAVPAGVGQHVGGAIGGAAQAASFRTRYPRGGA